MWTLARLRGSVASPLCVPVAVVGPSGVPAQPAASTWSLEWTGSKTRRAQDAGVPLRDVQIAARHADPRATTRYDRPAAGRRHSRERVAMRAPPLFLQPGAGQAQGAVNTVPTHRADFVLRAEWD